MYQEFLNQYLIMIRQNRDIPILYKNGSDLSLKIEKNMLHKVFFLYYYNELRLEEKLKMCQVVQEYQNIFYKSNNRQRYYFIDSFIRGRYESNRNIENKFFLQLLMCMELARLDKEQEQKMWGQYLVDIPVYYFENQYTLEQFNDDSFQNIYPMATKEEGKKILDSWLIKYWKVLYPLESEYRIDTLKVKLFYDRIFNYVFSNKRRRGS